MFLTSPRLAHSHHPIENHRRQKAHPGLALLSAAVQDGTQVGGFQGPLRYRLPRKFRILRGKGWSWRCVNGFNFCFFRLKEKEEEEKGPQNIYLAGKQGERAVNNITGENNISTKF